MLMYSMSVPFILLIKILDIPKTHIDFKRCVMTLLSDVNINKRIHRAVIDILEL